MKIALVAIEGSLMSSVSGLADLFWITQQALQTQSATPLPFSPDSSLQVSIVSADGNPVVTPQGRQMPVDGSWRDFIDPDVVLATGMGLGVDNLPPPSDSMFQAAEWIAECRQRGALVGGACAGTFLLGEAGLLRQRRCTTTWWLYHAFRKRFPSANVVRGSSLEEQDGIVTTGGPLSWVDLGLHVIRKQLGHKAARRAAELAVTDLHPLPQMAYVPHGYLHEEDPLLIQAEHVVRLRPGMTAVELAGALKVSERTLHRRMKALCGESPKAFITRIRMEMATLLLEARGSRIKLVATDCGYADETVFRRAFVAHFGVTPGEYRRRTRLSD